jgi:DNA anti-recombination protein RmuC
MTTSSLKNRRRQGIDRTRGQLDDTLEELTHKIVVPARVRDKVQEAKQNVRVKAEEVKQQVQAKADEVKQQGQAKAEEVKQQVHEGTEALQAEAEEVKQQGQAKAEEVKQQVHEGTEALQAEAAGVARQADRLTRDVLAKLPSPVAERIEPLMARARQWPLLTAAVALGVLLVLLVLRRLLRRNG